MALQTATRRAASSLNGAACISAVGANPFRRNATAMAVPTASPLRESRHDISVSLCDIQWDGIHADSLQKEASVPAPDPPADSQTAAIVGQHAPYMVATYVRPPPMMVKGEGCYLWDIENRRYLDFTAGIAVNALGHCDPEMSKLMAQQVRRSALAKPYTMLRIEHAGSDASAHLESLP